MSSIVKPLLHTWSLGVEEQFYLIWPAFLIFMAYWFPKWLIPSILFLFILSMKANIVLQKHHLDALFFLMPFRVFEFCIGAFLFFDPKKHAAPNYLKELIFTIGIMLVIYPAITFSSMTTFPSKHALIPTLGAACLIYAGDAKYLGCLLSNKLARGIGLISYSLYLVHWPIIVFSTYLFRPNSTNAHYIVVAAVCFASAYIMYRYIEQPFRKRRPPTQSKSLSQTHKLALSSMIIVLLGSSIYFTDGWFWRIPKENREIFKNNMAVLKGITDPKSFHINNFGGAGYPYPHGYTFKTKQAKDGAQIVLLGDSHTQMLQHGLATKVGKPSQVDIYISGTSCLTLPGITRLTPGYPWNKLCKEAVEHGVTFLKKRKNAVLILSEAWPSQITIAGFSKNSQPLGINPDSSKYEDYAKLIDRLDALRQLIGEHPLLLLGEVPGTGNNDAFSCLTKPFHMMGACGNRLQTSINANNRAINLNKILARYAQERRNTFFLNPYDYFCDKKVCHSIDNSGNPYYSDSGHLSKAGSLFLIDQIKEKILRLATNQTA